MSEVKGEKRRSSLSSHLLAEALAGSWRASPPEPRLTADELGRVVPALVGSGAAALAWWKLRRSSLREHPAAETLRQSYRRQTLEVAFREREIEHVFALLRAAGVEPILLKGWAAAGLYPERGLRPAGDINLCVRPEQYDAARAALWGPGRKGTTVTDLKHDAAALTCAGGWDALYARTRLVALGGARVRVLGREDLLRFLSLIFCATAPTAPSGSATSPPRSNQRPPPSTGTWRSARAARAYPRRRSPPAPLRGSSRRCCGSGSDPAGPSTRRVS